MILTVSSVFSDDWVLGAQEFSFEQPGKHAESELKAATVIPQLVLERIAQGNLRTISKNEKLDRRLSALQTERLSLFLQLSKEYKTRDALVLSKKSARELDRALKEEAEKIADLEDKIAENLKAADKTIKEINDSKEPIPDERIVLYKNDSSSLFVPSADAKINGVQSWAYSKDIANAKINGIITGKIVSYGEYAAITAELFLFPGCKSAGAVTEVGLLSDSLSIARRLVHGLSSKIANSLPVNLNFEIGPVDAREKCTINIDGVVYPNYAEGVLIDAGIHNITIESENFATVSFNYSFGSESQYLIRTDLEPRAKGIFKIKLKSPQNGIFYSRALEGHEVNEENPQAPLTINGSSVIGVFTKYDLPDGTVADSTQNSAFFYVPQKNLFDGADFTVKVEPYNREKNIDHRRKVMYTAYTCLICSLPVTFYTVGNFTATNNSYASGNRTITYEDVQKWQKMSYGSLAVTGVFGVWTAFEIYRYLKATNDVLPATAY